MLTVDGLAATFSKVLGKPVRAPARRCGSAVLLFKAPLGTTWWPYSLLQAIFYGRQGGVVIIVQHLCHDDHVGDVCISLGV